MKQLIVRAVLGGLLLFVWSMIAHLPPVGTAGEAAVPAAEGDALLSAMRRSMHERAVYVLPSIGADWQTRYLAGPAAVVVYNPRPSEHVLVGTPYASWLAIELGSDFLAAFLAALIAMALSPRIGYWPRVAVFTLVGVIGTIDIEVGYWNWFAYPATYLLAQLVDHAGGWFVVGLLFPRSATLNAHRS